MSANVSRDTYINSATTAPCDSPRLFAVLDDKIFEIIPDIWFAFVGVVSEINLGYSVRSGGDGVVHEVGHGEDQRVVECRRQKRNQRVDEDSDNDSNSAVQTTVAQILASRTWADSRRAKYKVESKCRLSD
jgi:hypothetical protein